MLKDSHSPVLVLSSLCILFIVTVPKYNRNTNLPKLKCVVGGDVSFPSL